MLPVASALLCLIAGLALRASGAETWVDVPSGPIPIPKYSRSKVPNYLIPEANRDGGISHLGHNSGRLRVFLDKLLKGNHVKVSLAGGSITVGHGSSDGLAWPQYLENWFHDAFPGQVTLRNGGVAGTTSVYQSICTSLHAGLDADLYILEYSHNDHSGDADPPEHSQFRRGMERLIRKLLSLPQKPAVMFNHAYVWFETKGAFWGNTERDFHEYELYYSLPAVSVKGCCYHLMRKNVTGFRVDQFRYEQPLVDRKYLTFSSDGVHPDGHTGARVLSELVSYLFLKELELLQSTRPLNIGDIAAAAEPIPPSMVPNNEPAALERCFVSSAFEQIVHSADNFQWLDESPMGRPRKKWGYVATKVGAALKLKFNTTVNSIAAQSANKLVKVMVAYLQSYEHMGTFSVSCESGCICENQILRGHHPERKVSQMEIHTLFTSQSDNCILVIKVLPETTSGENKVKIQGIFVSEEVGDTYQFATRGAIDTLQVQM